MKKKDRHHEFKEILTPIDNIGSFYNHYKGLSVGRAIHYIYCICGLEYAQNVIFEGNGWISYQNNLFATVHWNNGYPYFNFRYAYFNNKQEKLLEGE